MLEIQNVGMYFSIKGKMFKSEKKAVVIRDFNMTIEDSEIIAVVGESGCGKTTVGKIITGLLKPTSGKLYFDGEDIDQEKKKKSSDYRRSVQFIQQDSYAALNPVKTIHQSLMAALETYDPHITKQAADARIEELMAYVGLTPTERYLFRYPHQLSGGQRQRVLMTRALAMNPKLIVADEPVSMIDVSLRVSILKLIEKLNRDFKIAFVYITHDLATAKFIAESGKICVMYLGDIVEFGPVNDVLFHPKHPYTRALISAVPIPDPKVSRGDRKIPICGMEMTGLTERGRGCSFAPRCPYAAEQCRQAPVACVTVGDTQVRCCRLNEVPEWT